MSIKNKIKISSILASVFIIVLAIIVPSVLAETPGLPTRGNPAMAYDSDCDKVVIFGGWNMTSPPAKQDTWVYDYKSDEYTRKTPELSPSRRAESAIAYDSLRDMIILFGGKENTTSTGDLGDTWTYDYFTNTWEKLTPLTAPSARRAHRMVYDSESDRFIIFGGTYQTSTFYNETWIGNPNVNSFSKANPSIAPPARAFHHMVYDSESDRVILFGGASGTSSNSFFDTWAYDYNTNTWENLTDVNNHPPARSSHIMAYDSESDKIVLFGGGNLTATFSDTWLYDYNTNSWEEVFPSVSPSARCRHEAAYDSEADRVIIYGGTVGPWDSGSVLVSESKTWGYDVNRNRWEELDVLPPIPGYSIPILIGSLSLVIVIISKHINKRVKKIKSS